MLNSPLFPLYTDFPLLFCRQIHALITLLESNLLFKYLFFLRSVGGEIYFLFVFSVWSYGEDHVPLETSPEGGHDAQHREDDHRGP